MNELWKMKGRNGSAFIFVNISFESIEIRIDASNEEVAWMMLAEHVKDDTAGIYFTEQESKYIKLLLHGNPPEDEETKKVILDKMIKKGVFL
ncbi:hypothetical protein [Paenibacillus alba]|uniref:Uncharacterized protein n=1 Tax=Paenibacillus alba TaxID=1197127 RepID=A0ABU6GDE7_9BACL|nr:hypothetical protein [Paenibacillus alba]MEC0231267.1 hypothetical protein [Paenibacillus alba]